MLTEPVLAHRLIVTPAARLKKFTASKLLRDVLSQLPLPDSKVVG